MIRDIPKPEISEAFTIADIHKIREWNYERLKDATTAERLEDTKRRADAGWQRIEQLRKQKEAAKGA